MNLPFETSRILIVDDEERNVDLLCQALRHAGYTRLHTTTDPREVLSIYKEVDPDLLLLICECLMWTGSLLWSNWALCWRRIFSHIDPDGPDR